MNYTEAFVASCAIAPNPASQSFTLAISHTMPNPKPLNNLFSHLSQLNQGFFKTSNNLYMIELVKQKIESRGYQDFDKGDIMDELGKLQYQLKELEDCLHRVASDLKSL
jgi:hypothetical protein